MSHSAAVFVMDDDNRNSIASEILSYAGSKKTIVINMLKKSADVSAFVASAEVAGWIHQNNPVVYFAITPSTVRHIGLNTLQSMVLPIVSGRIAFVLKAQPFWTNSRPLLRGRVYYWRCRSDVWNYTTMAAAAQNPLLQG